MGLDQRHGSVRHPKWRSRIRRLRPRIRRLIHQQCPRLHLYRRHLQRPHRGAHRDLENRPDRCNLPIISPANNSTTTSRADLTDIMPHCGNCSRTSGALRFGCRRSTPSQHGCSISLNCLRRGWLCQARHGVASAKNGAWDAPFPKLETAESILSGRGAGLPRSSSRFHQ